MNARRRASIVLGMVVVCAAAIAAAPVRHAMLRTAGEFLVRSDSPQAADLIAVDWESEEAGQLEASDLYYKYYKAKALRACRKINRLTCGAGRILIDGI